MSARITLPTQCVTVTSGYVAKSGVAGDVGRWFHNVSYIGSDGRETPTLSTLSLGYARLSGLRLSEMKKCPFVDRGEKEPRR